MDKVITISRQYGSGGSEIGRKIAKEFGIRYYDDEIITQAAKESGLSERVFQNAEDKAANSLLYSIAMGMNTFGSLEYGISGLSLYDKVFFAQAEVIRRAAEDGSCVIVGRCADYILKDHPKVVHIFICADLNYRRNRVMAEHDIPSEKAEERILKKDKQRANYYNYHTNQKWGRADNYHLSLRSDYGGVDHAVNCIKAFLEINKQGVKMEL